MPELDKNLDNAFPYLPQVTSHDTGTFSRKRANRCPLVFTNNKENTSGVFLRELH